MHLVARASVAFMAIVTIGIPLFASAETKPTCVISTPPGTLYPGYTAQLVWYTHEASHAYLSNGVGEVNVPSGSVDVHPSVSTLYTMTVTNSAGKNTCGVVVTITQQPPPSLLTYYPPVQQPIVFTPLAYTNVYIPYNGYGGYYVPYSPNLNYSAGYSDNSRVYNQKYDFWADYTQGRSTGPSLFGETYSPNYPPYREYYIETLPNGMSRYTTRECIDGIGCRTTGTGNPYSYDTFTPDEKGGSAFAPDWNGYSYDTFTPDKQQRQPPQDILPMPPQEQEQVPPWMDSRPRMYTASDDGTTDFVDGGRSDNNLLLTSYEPQSGTIINGTGYNESSYYAEGSYYSENSYVTPATYNQDTTSYGSPYLTQMTYTPQDTYSEGYYESSY